MHMAELHAIRFIVVAVFLPLCTAMNQWHLLADDPPHPELGGNAKLPGVQYVEPSEQNMPSEEWEDRWDKVVKAGREKGCSADLVHFVPRSSGFGAKMWHRLTSMWLAMMNPTISYVWDGSEKFDSTWWSFFQNEAGIATPQGCDFADPRFLPDFDYALVKGVERAAAEANHHYMASMKHFVAMKMWTLKPDVQAAIEASLAPVLGKEVFTQGDYIGVHIRRGDKAYEAPATATQVYVDEILKSSLELGLNVVYIATDDPNVVGEAQQMLAGNIAVVNLPASGADSRGFYDDPASVFSLLTDITALQHAKVFIGTSTSGFGRLVYWLRDEDRVSISVDGTNDFLTTPF